VARGGSLPFAEVIVEPPRRAKPPPAPRAERAPRLTRAGMPDVALTVTLCPACGLSTRLPPCWVAWVKLRFTRGLQRWPPQAPRHPRVSSTDMRALNRRPHPQITSSSPHDLISSARRASSPAPFSRPPISSRPAFAPPPPPSPPRAPRSLRLPSTPSSPARRTPSTGSRRAPRPGSGRRGSRSSWTGAPAGSRRAPWTTRRAARTIAGGPAPPGAGPIRTATKPPPNRSA